MDWRSHVLIGAVLAGFVFWVLGTNTLDLLIVTVFGGLSALVPDLDHDSSKGRKWLDIAFLGFALMTMYGSACGANLCIPSITRLGGMLTAFFAMAGVYFLFFRFLKPRHRGITHTLVACLVFGVLLYFMTGKELAFAGFIGYFSHLLADRHVKLV